MSDIGSPKKSGAVWWLSPVSVPLIVSVLSIVPTLLISDQRFRALWKTPKVITTETYLLFMAAGLALAVGAFAVLAAFPAKPRRSNAWPGLDDTEIRVLRTSSTVLVTLTVIGYVAFIGAAIRAGVGIPELTAALGPDSYHSGIKEQIGTVPGVTTLTQFGIASVIVSSLLISSSPRRTDVLRLIIVFALALPRSFLLTERLAILELVVPMVVVFAARYSAAGRGRRIVKLMPVIAAPFVFAVFATFEYFRSWQFFRATSGGNFGDFALERLAGYYATALNNGHLTLVHTGGVGQWPYRTIEAFWIAPGIKSWTWEQPQFHTYSEEYYADMLAQFGNPEFNNASGFVTGFGDYGSIGGIVYFLIMGVVAGCLYRGFRSSAGLGMLLYPIIFLGILELPRYLYWSQGRALPAIVALAIVAFALRRAKSREATLSRRQQRLLLVGASVKES
jgi:oligosaccharide repeat unit polymerase